MGLVNLDFIFPFFMSLIWWRDLFMEILNYQGFEFSHRRLKIKDIFNLLYLSLTL